MKCVHSKELRAAIWMLVLISPVEAVPKEAFSPHVRELVARLTLDEKLAITQGTRDPIDGGQAGYSAGVPRLGIPALRWVDGPAGIDNRYDATNLPAMLAVAATFDPEASRQAGDLTGREARATRMDVFLGPMVNIARVPSWGRNVTSFGEDPLLTSRMVVPMVTATEKWGVITTTKHFIANNQTLNVNGPTKLISGADFIVDERTRHEIYLPAFEAALHAGGGGVMSGYNRINGPHSTDSRIMQTDLLRGELGWNGFIVSDWGAVHSTESLQAGLDVEMPGDVITADGLPYYFGSTLKAAIQSGKVPQEALDRAVMRVLTQMERMGMLDGKRVPAAEHVDVSSDARTARVLASEGAVLLKNDGILPLKPSLLKSLAIIGPNGGQLAPSQGFGAAVGIESRRVSPLQALRESLPANTLIKYAVGDDLTGMAIPSSALKHDDGKSGLIRTPDDGTAPAVDGTVDYTGEKSLPMGRGYTWSGNLSVPEDGEYTLNTQSWGGYTILEVDGKQVAKSAKPPLTFGVPRKTAGFIPTTDGLDNGQFAIRMQTGKSYSIKLVAQAEPESRMQVRLAWITPEMRREQIRLAAVAAGEADAVLVFVWQRGGEWAQNQENLALPNGQDALIDAVATANPNTVVVLNTAGPVTMPWKEKVKGILEMWFPGQEGGWATSDVLLGKANPGGKLPITFPARFEDSPVFAPGHPERYFGVDPSAGPGNKVIYSEGIFVGYRYFDQNQIEPLFPFGYGLSYTTFTYSGLTAVPAGDGVDVNFSVRNSGSVRGAEVTQVYLGRPETPSLPMAPQALAGFSRVELEPGAQRPVKIHVAARQLSNWAPEQRKWRIEPGRRSILVGSSSRDIRLKMSVEIGAR